MKKKTFIFLLLQIQIMTIYSQEYVYQNVQMLTVNNQQFFSMIDTIVDFEKKYMDDFISDTRSYLINYELFYDTTIIITSFYPINADNVLLSSMYGVFMYRSRLIFVMKRIGDNFIQNENILSVETWEKTDLPHLIIDDSMTRWKFLLSRGNLIFKSREGFSYQKKYQEKYIHIIDIIEEKADDFPD